MKSHKEQAEAKWESDPKLREEFMDDKEAWLAYAEAEAKGMTGGPTDGAKSSKNQTRKATSQEDSGLTGDDLEKQAKTEWEQSAETRSEFGGEFETFFAWFKADAKGLIKTIG